MLKYILIYNNFAVLTEELWFWQCDRLQMSLWTFHSLGSETFGMFKSFFRISGFFSMYKIQIKISTTALRIRTICKTCIKIFSAQ